VNGRSVDRDQVALLAAQSRVRTVVRRVVWRDFGQVASPELIERVCEAVFKELRLCCSECAGERRAEAGLNGGCRCR
jgi:hypothetical protein